MSAEPPLDPGRHTSPDSGLHWAESGMWSVADGVWRIPLPLPHDSLVAVNVYVLDSGNGLTLIDGGWALDAARSTLEQSLTGKGFTLRDIREFLVTHVHRDHYTMAAVLGQEVGATVRLGSEERPALDTARAGIRAVVGRTIDQLRAAGAAELAASWGAAPAEAADLLMWRYPDVWLEGDTRLEVGDRELLAVPTPGHTRGHYVFSDRSAGLLFAGDHVLPTITPSIGFEPDPTLSPLRDFLASLAKVRAMPDARLLPAHGPVTDSAHARVDELIAHHDGRLADCLGAFATPTERTAYDIANALPWTRRRKKLAELDPFNAALATMETKVHLDLLVAQGQLASTLSDGIALYQRTEETPRAPEQARDRRGLQVGTRPGVS